MSRIEISQISFDIINLQLSRVGRPVFVKQVVALIYGRSLIVCTHSVGVLSVIDLSKQANVRFTELYALSQSIYSKVIIFLNIRNNCTAEINLRCSFSSLFGRSINFEYISKTKFIETHCDAFRTHLNRPNVFRVAYALLLRLGCVFRFRMVVFFFDTRCPMYVQCTFCVGEIFWNSLPSARNHAF
ncbi:Hypothetical_protein [Hexamita inflata]|uniref:Hypothetical_protein n=1 Tax=Hexamita inflata TaxID=28002 RepID=A0AA86VNV8_9EUKA|nr:Hypothetical protein HINF_LOCUS59433 [Hexamita inflata]